VTARQHIVDLRSLGPRLPTMSHDRFGSFSTDPTTLAAGSCPLRPENEPEAGRDR
jgi:hypothetical protein